MLTPKPHSRPANLHISRARTGCSQSELPSSHACCAYSMRLMPAACRPCLAPPCTDQTPCPCSCCHQPQPSCLCSTQSRRSHCHGTLGCGSEPCPPCRPISANKAGNCQSTSMADLPSAPAARARPWIQSDSILIHEQVATADQCRRHAITAQFAIRVANRSGLARACPALGGHPEGGYTSGGRSPL
jgi:hypothetical protein